MSFNRECTLGLLTFNSYVGKSLRVESNLPGHMFLFTREVCIFLVLGLLCVPSRAQLSPPFHGTIFIDPDIVLQSDPSVFEVVTSRGQGRRTMYDRRPENWISVNAWLFEARFSDGTVCEIQVNPEFATEQEARAPAQQFAWAIGQLPAALRKDVETVWIHRGLYGFGGGNRNLLIHVGQAEAYIADGILEEVFIHEASHTSLDEYHAASSGWLAAQREDGRFISVYARDYPNREDIAETFLTWFAVRHRSNRISSSLKSTIESAVPARLNYFDGLHLDLYPAVSQTTPIISVHESITIYRRWHGQFDLKGRSYQSKKFAK